MPLTWAHFSLDTRRSWDHIWSRELTSPGWLHLVGVWRRRICHFIPAIKNNIRLKNLGLLINTCKRLDEKYRLAFLEHKNTHLEKLLIWHKHTRNMFPHEIVTWWHVCDPWDIIVTWWPSLVRNLVSRIIRSFSGVIKINFLPRPPWPVTRTHILRVSANISHIQQQGLLSGSDRVNL